MRRNKFDGILGVYITIVLTGDKNTPSNEINLPPLDAHSTIYLMYYNATSAFALSRPLHILFATSVLQEDSNNS